MSSHKINATTNHKQATWEKWDAHLFLYRLQQPLSGFFIWKIKLKKNCHKTYQEKQSQWYIIIFQLYNNIIQIWSITHIWLSINEKSQTWSCGHVWIFVEPNPLWGFDSSGENPCVIKPDYLILEKVSLFWWYIIRGLIILLSIFHFHTVDLSLEPLWAMHKHSHKFC